MGFLDWLFGPPKPDQYARLICDGLRRAGDHRESAYDRESFALNFTQNGEPAGLANLRNMYNEYCSLPRDKRPEHLKLVVRAMLSYQLELPEEYEDARHDLLPAVRTRSYFELMRLQQEVEGHHDPETPPYQEIGDHLLVSVVYDLPESMRSINRQSLEEWGIGFYEALEAARANLEEMQFAFASLGTRVYASVTGDNYDASRILLLDFVNKLEVDGDPVAVVPNRDTLLITGSEDTEGLLMVADLAERALDKPRPMNAIPLRLTDGEWVTWLPDPSHPTAGKFRMLEVKSLYSEYAEQKSLLDALHERNGIDRFVASYTAIETKDGRVLSYSVWSQDVESMLPQTHEVIFYSGDEERLVARGEWSRVWEIVGDLMQPLDVYPKRYLVTEFPSAEQLAEIGMGTDGLPSPG